MSAGEPRCDLHARVRCPECRQALNATREPAPGDIVTLNSGGPDLTVLRVYDDGGRVADLGWFTAAGEYRTGTLPLVVLRLRSKVERIAPDRPRSAVELHAIEAHPDFEYWTVTFMGRTADPDIAPNPADGAWVRNLHRHGGWEKLVDREVTHWMRPKAERVRWQVQSERDELQERADTAESELCRLTHHKRGAGCSIPGCRNYIPTGSSGSEAPQARASAWLTGLR